MINRRGLSGAVAIVMSSVLISRLTGFLREMLVPNLMDAASSDAYNMAFRITGLLYEMLVGGAIAAALIPMLTGYIAKGREKQGWHVAGTFINMVLLISIAACILGIVFAKPLVRLFAVGYKGQLVEEETVTVTRILFPSVVFLMLAGLVNGVLNSYNRFAAAAYGPSIYNIGSCVSIALFGGKNLPAVAWGVVASALIYFIIQLIFAIPNMRLYEFRFYIYNRGFHRMVRYAVPSLIASSIIQLNLVISSTFATLFPEGSVTALNMADKTWQVPLGIVAQGIGIAILPALSAHLARGDLGEYKSILQKALRVVVLLTMPAAVGMMVMNREIVSAVFRFSSGFNPDYIPMAGSMLLYFSLALVFQSVVIVMNRAFYATNDTKTPLYCGIATMAVNIMLCFVFYHVFRHVLIMAAAYSLSSIVNCLLLLGIMDRKLQGIYLDRILAFSGKTALATLLMALVVLAMRVIPVPEGKTGELLLLMFKAMAGAAVFFMAGFALRLQEISDIFRRLLLTAGKLLSRHPSRRGSCEK
ncbi:MAG TPA: murein biosynthesis integral membrane protein MurJ [Clostridiales bacterium]|nr:murein biosynthesis integral membrane protein MurJ [Clostridiales bacterium]